MNNICQDIRIRLYELADPIYKQFQSKLMPGYPTEKILGVRTPDLRKLAAEMSKHDDIGGFLSRLPHEYYDEMNLHSYIIQRYKSFDEGIRAVEALLPHIDNWATCDLLSPKVFSEHSDELLPYIHRWIGSSHVYTVRYAIVCLMRYFLGDNYKPEYSDMAARSCTDEYYINMAVAWYFATALATNYDEALTYLTERRLPVWVHNKAIQKAVESRLITGDIKTYLKTLRIKQKAAN